MYQGRSLAALNRLITGQATHPLGDYLAEWAGLRGWLLLELCLVGSLMMVLARPELKQNWRALRSTGCKSSFRSNSAANVYLALFAALCYAICFSFTGLKEDFGLFFEPHDLRVYFNSSAWAIGQGRLYLTVRSEYPVLANLIFGAVRAIAEKAHFSGSAFANFCAVWILAGSIAFLGLLPGLKKRSASWSLWLLLLLFAPATIYFSLTRFDIYPALASFWALYFVRRRKWNLAALLFGVCAALKGYALMLLPAFFIYCFSQVGFAGAMTAVLWMLSVPIATHAAVFAWGGSTALYAPYRLQVFRQLNVESTFNSILFVFIKLGVSPAHIAWMVQELMRHHLPILLQAATSLVAFAFRPARFQAFVDASFLSVLGFITFSAFHSPQFVIWLIPFLLFTHDRILLFLGIFLAWVTYLYFPVLYHIAIDDPRYLALFFSCVLVVTVVHLVMMVRSIGNLAHHRKTYLEHVRPKFAAAGSKDSIHARKPAALSM
jgi:hypothetical protein